jgi:hypothetical protein
MEFNKISQFTAESTLLTSIHPVLLSGIAILVVLTVIFLARLIYTTFLLNSFLAQSTKNIQKMTGAYPYFTGRTLNLLRAEFKKKSNYPNFSFCWSEFEETLIFEELEGSDPKVFNTRAATEFFSKSQIIEPYINFTWHASVPSVITGVGLLLTFTAILLGMDGIVTNNQINQEGVTHLVGNLSGKFLSSVVSITLATIYLIFERWLSASVYKSYHSFIEALDRNFQRKTSEALLEQICQAVTEQSHATKQFSTSLSGHLKEGVSEGMRPLMQDLKSTLDIIKDSQSNSMAGMVEKMMGDFRSAMMGSASGEMDKLASSMSSTATLLQQSNQQSSELTASVGKIMNQLESQSIKQSEESSRQLTTMKGMFEEIAQSLAKSSNDASTSVTSRVQNVLEGLEQTSRLLLDENKKQVMQLGQIFEQQTAAGREQIETLLNSVLQAAESMKNSSEGNVSQISEKIAQLLEKLSTTSKNQLQESEKHTRSLTELVASLTTDVKLGMLQVTDTMQKQVSGLLTQNTDSSSKTSELTNRLLEREDANIAGLSRAKEELAQLMDQYKETINGTTKTVSEFQTTANTFQSAASHVNKSLESAQRVQDTSVNLSREASQQLDSLTGVFDRHKDLLAQYQSVFNAMDDNLGKVLEQLGDRISQYNRDIVNSLQLNLNRFDDSLAKATSSLGSTVNELEDKLESLAEVSRAAAKVELN